MKRNAALLALLAIFVIGVGVAFASIGSTGTVVACATATTPAQTIDDNGSPIATVPSTTNANCVTTTYTIPTVTTTVGGTTTAPPTTTTAPTTTTTTTTPAPSSTFTTSLTENGTITTPYVWTFDPGTPTTAGYFWADGKLLAKVTGPGPYMYTIEPGTLADGAHTLGHAWDLASDGSHHSPPSAYDETVSNPATASPASLTFDGRATQMTALSSTGYAATNNIAQTQTPTLWDCVCFTNNDIKLTADARYTQVYGINVEDGSRNPYNSETTASCSCASAELSHRQTMTVGETDWYANAYRIPTTWTQPDWDAIFQFGYPTLASPPVALEVVPNSSGTPSFSIDWNAGLLTNKNNNQDYVGSHIGHDPFLPVPLGQWVQIVIGVKWETANTGSIRIYTRVPSQGASWTLSLSEDNIATLQYGTTPYGSCAADYSDCPTVTDHGGLYYGYWSWPGTFPSNHVDQTGLAIAADLADAEASFPS